MILTLRTDKTESEIGLYNGDTKIVYETWEAHRKLAETIHLKLKTVLEGQGKQPEDMTGIVIYKGPGSFTGLRIGMSVANALAYSLEIPIVATAGDEWIQEGLVSIQNAPKDTFVAPEYGAAPHITAQKK
jgi:tRNA threonylcarbamoyladenosine biosynthesis protein TsaB